MSYRSTKVIIKDGTQFETVYSAERIGTNLAIHRNIEEDPYFPGEPAAIGKTWTVTLHPFGAALVTGIRSRAEARRIARTLVTAVAEFRAAVESSRRLVNEPNTPVDALEVF